MAIRLQVLNARPALGTFSKAIEGSVTLNFGRSGGKNCDTDCIHHPDNTAANATNQCYAVNTEVRFDRKTLRLKLNRHERTNPANLCRKALGELREMVRRGWTPPWFRFSASGSVPMPRDARKDFLDALRELLDFLDEHNVPVHLPVETPSKAEFYRKAVGWRAVVRESVHDESRFLKIRKPVSYVAGRSSMSRGERITEAKRLAALRRERTGRKVIVCPAVASRYIQFERLRAAGAPNPHRAAGDPKSKCGNCVCCADPTMDIIYPLH
jgi:hypothetical protein